MVDQFFLRRTQAEACDSMSTNMRESWPAGYRYWPRRRSKYCVENGEVCGGNIRTSCEIMRLLSMSQIKWAAYHFAVEAKFRWTVELNDLLIFPVTFQRFLQTKYLKYSFLFCQKEKFKQQFSGFLVCGSHSNTRNIELLSWDKEIQRGS